MAQAPSFEENPILAKFLGDFAKVAETRFRQSARAADLELTGELISSIRAGAVERGKATSRAAFRFRSCCGSKTRRRCGIRRCRC